MTPPEFPKGEKHRALGRGLDALLSPVATAPSAPTGNEVAFTCPIERIIPQSDQPRRHFDDQKLDELAQSIRANGVIQPVVVRRSSAKTPAGAEQFEIIAGERRWRAAQRAGLHEVPIFVRELSEARVFEAALIENEDRHLV